MFRRDVENLSSQTTQISSQFRDNFRIVHETTKRILSPPRLPASGGGGLLPLNRPIFEAEGNFSATTEGDSSYF